MPPQNFFLFCNRVWSDIVLVFGPYLPVKGDLHVRGHASFFIITSHLHLCGYLIVYQIRISSCTTTHRSQFYFLHLIRSPTKLFSFLSFFFHGDRDQRQLTNCLKTAFLQARLFSFATNLQSLLDLSHFQITTF